MKNKYLIITLVVLAIIGVGVFFVLKNSGNNGNNYTAERQEATLNVPSNHDNTAVSNTTSNDNGKVGTDPNSNGTVKDSNNSNENNQNGNNRKTASAEKEIATYTTKIYSKDSARQHNVELTCNTLNDTVVENGATFSFCNTVGQATTAKGYQKAEIFDNKRK